MSEEDIKHPFVEYWGHPDGSVTLNVLMKDLHEENCCEHTGDIIRVEFLK